MKRTETKPVDELFWELNDLVIAERDILEKLVRQLSIEAGPGRQRRPYPKVFPKYRNPRNPGETWCGRGTQPRWLTAELRGGKRLSDFMIRPTAVSDEP
jgi:DNA-binding protein H-NS